jgi:hypothetical protein
VKRDTLHTRLFSISFALGLHPFELVNEQIFYHPSDLTPSLRLESIPLKKPSQRGHRAASASCHNGLGWRSVWPGNLENRARCGGHILSGRETGPFPVVRGSSQLADTRSLWSQSPEPPGEVPSPSWRSTPLYPPSRRPSRYYCLGGEVPPFSRQKLDRKPE